MRTKRLLSVLLAVIMVIGLVPGTVFAAEATGVAKVGSNQYDTLTEAINAANGGAITLLADIEITEETTFNMVNGTVLDLNGKTIKADDGKAIFAGTTFTIKNGTVTGLNGTDYYAITIDSASTKALRSTSNIVLEDLTFTNTGVKIRGGATVTLKDNSITANQSKFKYAVWAYGSANVTIESGTYFGGKNGYDVFVEGNAKFVANGGTYKFKIVERNIVNEDFAAVENADGTYTVKAPNYVAQVGETKYESLQEAIDAEGDTVILLENKFALENGSVLDLASKTLVTVGVTFTGNDITIKNGEIALPEGNSNYYVLYIGSQNDDKTTATLKGVETTAGIQAINADVTLDDVTAVAGYHKTRYAVAAFQNSNVTILSGTYTTTHPSTKRALSMDDTSTFAVKGGAFSKDVPVDYLAEGYISVKDGSQYIVREGKQVAEVNGKKYETLHDAINAAPTYYDVILLADIEATEQIVITKNINLVLGEYTITGTSDDAIVRIYSDEVDTEISVGICATAGGIVNNGTGYAIYAGEDLDGGNDAERTYLTINGGNYETAGTDCIKQIMGRLTINGGSYKSSYGRTVLNGQRYYFSEFTINGGSFYGFNPACVSVWTGGNDGTLYHHHDIIATGKTATYADGWYTVVDGTYTAKVETKSLCYPSLAAALYASINLDDVANLGVITLLADDTMDLDGATIELPAGLVIDLNGNTLTVPFQQTLFAGENITIKNGTITTGSTKNYGLYIMSGSFTLENLTLTNGLNVQAGTVTLEDCDVTCPNKYYAVYAGANADVTILSGSYNTVRNAKNLYADGKITVYGGTFNKMPEAKHLAEDRHVVKSGFVYTVYEGFKAALAAAEDGDTVYLMSDIEVAETISIEKSITLDLGESTITSTAAKNVIYSTADLTIDATTGGIYSETAYVAVGQDNGVCTIDGGSFKASGDTGDYANGQPVYNTLVLNNSDFYEGVTGSFVINGGKFYGFNPACMSVNKHDHHDHNNMGAGLIATLDAEGWFTVTEGEFKYMVVCDCSAPASAHQHCFATVAEAELFIKLNGSCPYDKIVDCER